MSSHIIPWWKKSKKKHFTYFKCLWTISMHSPKSWLYVTFSIQLIIIPHLCPQLAKHVHLHIVMWCFVYVPVIDWRNEKVMPPQAAFAEHGVRGGVTTPCPGQAQPDAVSAPDRAARDLKPFLGTSKLSLAWFRRRNSVVLEHPKSCYEEECLGFWGISSNEKWAPGSWDCKNSYHLRCV